MFYFDNIIISGDLGKRHFTFPDGTKSKTFYDAQKFNFRYGQFPILDKNGKVVEFMDILGNFSQDNTDLAADLYYYAISINNVPVKNFGKRGSYYTGLLDFPSKHLVDEKVRNFIQEQEDLRFDSFCKFGQFNNLFEKLRYKRYIKQVFKNKIKKASSLIEQTEKEQIEL